MLKPIPNAGAPFVDGNGIITREWFRLLSDLVTVVYSNDFDLGVEPSKYSTSG